MRTILKIIAAPFVLALMLIVAVLSFLCLHGGRCAAALRVRCLSLLAILLPAWPGRHTGCIAMFWCWRSWFPPLGSRPLERLAGGASVWGEVCLAMDFMTS